MLLKIARHRRARPRAAGCSLGPSRHRARARLDRPVARPARRDRRAMTPVMFAYGGWQTTSFVAGEMRDPRRDLARGAAVRRRRRRRALHRRRLHLRLCARPAGPGRTAHAGDRGDAARARRDRRDPDRARHRHLGARLPQPGHADHAARLFRHGRGPAVLPRRRQGRPRTRAPVVAILLQGAAATAIALSGTLRADPDLRRLGRLHLVRPDRRRLVRLPPPRAGARPASRRPAIPSPPACSSLACAADRRRARSTTIPPTARSACSSSPPASRPSSTGSAGRDGAHEGDPVRLYALGEDPAAGPLQPRARARCRISRSTASRSSIADLELDGASRYRYPPLREAIAAKVRRRARAGGDGRRHLDGQHARHGRPDRARRRGAGRASRPTSRWSRPRASSAPRSRSFDRAEAGLRARSRRGRARR